MMKFLLLAFATLFLFLDPAHAAERPNIIVIFTDDHGWADLGSQGIEKDIRTPHLDALAKGGLRATNGYVSAPQCVPSRAGLLTGRYQNRFGVESNGEALDGFNQQKTIAKWLKEAGYATGMAGKWHLGPPDEIVKHGFDDVSCDQGGPKRSRSNLDRDRPTRPRENRKEEQYHLDANSAAACEFIERHKDQPFFFYLAYRAPHVPLDAPKKYLDRFPGEMPERRRQCLAMLSAVDDGVGRVLETLRKHQLEENTLIFFLGDNGAPLKIHKEDEAGGGAGWDGSLNAPLNGEKGMLAEGGIRVPWLASWKGVIPKGQVYEHPVISLDVAATALAAAGINTQAARLDGVNLLPYLTGQNKSAPHEALFWRWIAQSAIREGQWKLIIGGERRYLFDLDKDPEEKRNLLSQHPKIAERLHARLKAWSNELQPPGLATGPMSKVWETYFDFYLDGKPVPPPRNGGSPQTEQSGWVAHNATAELREGFLHVSPISKGKGKPFLAFSGLKISGPATATLSLRSDVNGQVGIAWRLDSQQDFPASQIGHHKLNQSTEFQSLEIPVPGVGQIAHVRVLIPNGKTDLQRFEIQSKTGKDGKHWDFQTANTAP